MRRRASEIVYGARLELRLGALESSFIARRMVVVAGPGVAGDDGNELDGGDRRRECVEKRLQGPRRCVRSTVRIYVLW